MEEIKVLVSQQAGNITCNYDEMKAALLERLEEYRGAIFTEDTVATGKKCVAALRKEQAAFKSRISEVRSEHMKPFEEFKRRADELVALFDEPINLINEQLSDFEVQRRERKREEIRKLYNEIVDSDMRDYIPLERIFNSKWENATFSTSKIKEELWAVFDESQGAVALIKAMSTDATEQALEVYKKTLTLSEAVAYINRYEAQKAQILQAEQEKREQEKIEQARREERAKLEAEAALNKAQEEKEKAVEQAKQDVVDSLTPETDGASENYIYQFSLTPEGKEKFETYLDSVGIDWMLIG